LLARLVFALESYDTVAKREQGVVFAHTDVVARVDFRTTLTDDDVTSSYELAAEFLDTESTSR
jgi:hypothetical protein